MRRLFQRFMKKTTVVLLLLAVSAAICACQKTSNPSDTSGEHASVFGENVRDQLQKNPAYADYDAEPFVIRTVLREYTVINPETKAGAYGRYTELLVEGNAPDTFRDAISACNARAEKSVKTRADQIMTKKPASGAKRDGYQYVTLGYIATVTRADKTAFSLLETEFEKGSSNSSSDISYRFIGSTYDTASGEEIGLSDLIDENACSGLLKAALSTRNGIADLADTSPSSFAWTADALGIRFYFNSDAVSPDKRREISFSAASLRIMAKPKTCSSNTLMISLITTSSGRKGISISTGKGSDTRRAFSMIFQDLTAVSDVLPITDQSILTVF